MQHLKCASVTLNLFYYALPEEKNWFFAKEEVHEIIEKLCTANEFSQSKVTGLLVEEALRSRGVLTESFDQNKIDGKDFINYSFENDTFSTNNKFRGDGDDFTINKKLLSDDIKMMHEFIEFKYFKKVMKRNKNILNKKCHTYFIYMKLHFNKILD